MGMIEHACAKLNLSLDVLGKTGDGYHDLAMVMQSVEFGDDLDIRLTDDGSFSIDPGKRYLPSDGRNLALRAARVFLRGDPRGVSIRIRKRVPVCAGMGGGSSDAAAVLRALNRMTGAGKTAAELCDMAKEIGSDVPFCVVGGTVFAEGRGEIMTPLPPMPDCSIVIVKPSFPISTPVLFSRIDSRRSRLHPDTAGMLSAIRSGDLEGIARRSYNVFEEVLDQRQSAVFSIKKALLSFDALGTAMTGTGSAVFGIFSDKTKAECAFDSLRSLYSECFLTRPSPAEVL